MLRIIGALLIICGSTGLGLAYRSELYEGLRHMRLLRQMLEMIMSEIRYNKATLPECCRQVGKRMEEPYAGVLLDIYGILQEQSGGGFCECWQQEMGKCLAQIPISDREARMVLGFASCGALNDHDMQIRAIEQYRDMIADAVKKREEVLQQQGRMATGLGVLSGLLLVVLLI